MKLGKSVLAVAVAIAAVTPAMAQESGFYVGGAIGQMSTDLDTEELSSDIRASGFTHTPISKDDTDTAWKLIAGYRINRNFAAELSYLQLGEFSESTTISRPPSTATAGISGKWEAKNTFTLAGLGILPFGDRFSVFGKVGAYMTKIEQRASATVGSSTFTDVESVNSKGFLFGFGAGFDVTRNVTIRAEWERLTDVGDKEKTGEGDLDLLTIGAIFRFR